MSQNIQTSAMLFQGWQRGKETWLGKINSKAKGAKGERELSRLLKEYGYETRRGQNGRYKAGVNVFLTDDKMIYCFNSKEELLFFTDIEQSQNIVARKWGKLADGYCGSMENGKMVGAHRILTSAPEGMIVDHINGDKKDNRISNLRLCNKSENAYNAKLNSKNTSGYKGVYFRKDTQKWAAEIKSSGVKIVLGSFPSKSEAIKARKLAEIKYAGEFRRIV